MAVDLVIGSPPRGQDYFGRKNLIERLWTRLERDNVLLVAPRRFGKTGAMFQLLDHPREPFRPIFLDVEHIESPADLIIEILAALRQDNHFASVMKTMSKGGKAVWQWLQTSFSEVDIGSVKVHLREHTDVAANWRTYGDQVMRLLTQNGARLLLLLDEFPIMVHHVGQRDPAELRQFMRWFRGVRVAPETKTRFLIGGSINMVPTLDALGLVDTVNDFAIEQLPPFDDETALAFVREAMATRDIVLPAEVQKRIVAIIGTPVPYLLSVLMSALLELHKDGGVPITAEMVDRVFETELLQRATPFFLHYYSRLKDYYPENEERQAKAILNILSRSDASVASDTLYQAYLKVSNSPHTNDTAERFRRLMQKLENDFYVVGHESRYEFSNRTIGLWWKYNYGFQAP